DREAWWTKETTHPLLAHTGRILPLGLDEIYSRALAHSSQVKVYAATPLIRQTAIDEAEGDFDPELFTQTRYTRTHEPTGSLLDTGDTDDFFKERGWTSESGVRKRFKSGTSMSVVQEFSELTNNSEYFNPRDQGNAQLKLSVMQPLLQGAGAKYNETLIQIAKLDAETGYHEFISQLEDHLMGVNRTYWSLYLARSVYLEKKRLVSETQGVVDELESRGNLDSVASQRSRARSALATRKADLVRAELAIKNAESRLRTLVNDPVFVEDQIGEIIPADLPIAGAVVPDFRESVTDALAFRPEVHHAENQLKASDLREGMAKNETLPTLNMIGEVGVSALRSEGDWSGAFGDEFDDGEPTWSAGIVASLPWGRKSAKARHLRTQLEVRQSRDALRATLDQILLEVQIAYREATTAWPDTKAKWEAAKAADEELSTLRDRRDVESAESGTSLYLEKLLDAQERRALAREEYLTSLVVYNSALTNLERAKGTLLQEESIGVERTEDAAGLPLVKLVKREAADHAVKAYESFK
ncbi:MAG: TolC family protein, partial [Verrucomicrobiae bacterium]|nr:TolC family protein [Verrucomicrobiae bacterium]